VLERRRVAKYDPHDELQYEDFKKAPSMMVHGPKIFGSTQEKVAKNVTVIRNDDSESTNSDTDTWNLIKERNLKNLKRKAIHSRTRKQQEASTTDSSDDNDSQRKENARYYDRKYKMSSTASSSSSNSKKSGEHDQNDKQMQSTSSTLQNDQQPNSDKNSESSARPPRRKKSRWGEPSTSSTTTTATIPITSLPSSSTTTSSAAAANVITLDSLSSSKLPMLTSVTRSDPALLNYARLNFGTINLTEEEWLKAEEHFKINLLFQDMQRKRQEIDQLAKNGKFKYEYDSDEDINGGTWEHKLRSQEMEATLKWADALNSQCHGKHHIGDFLPPGKIINIHNYYL
jgi:splicing factor 4